MKSASWLFMLVSVFFILRTKLSHGQALSFQNIGKAQGLKSLASANCAIDQFGFFWIATADGLVRFDGKRTNYYYHRTHPDLPYDQIGFIFCDSQNQIWVCTERGLVRIDVNRNFHRQIVQYDKPEQKVSFCFESGNGEIYALSNGRAFVSSISGGQWELSPWLDSILFNKDICKVRRHDKDRYLIVHEGKGVFIVNTKTKKQETFIKVSHAYSVTSFEEDSILVGTFSHFHLYRSGINQSAVAEELYLSADNGSSVIQTPIIDMVHAIDGKIYITTSGDGLMILNLSSNTYTKMLRDPINPSSLVGNDLRNIYTDSTGILLISSVNGLNYTRIQNTLVSHIGYLLSPDGQIIDNRVVSIAEDSQSRLWICMIDHVLVFNRENGDVVQPIFPKSHHWRNSPQNPSWAIGSSQNEIWVSYQNEGIAIFYENLKLKKFIRSSDYPLIKNNLNQTRVMREGKDGFMYLGTEKGLFRIRLSDYALDTFQNDSCLIPILHERIVDVLPDSNELWFSSSPRGGAWQYDFADKVLKKFDLSNGLSTDRVYGLVKDSSGTIYAGGHNGLSIIHPNHQITQIVKDKGLIGPRIESLAKSPDGAIWLANNFTLLRYNPVDQSMFWLGKREGLFDVDFAIMAVTSLADGSIVFGANRGFILVNPNEFKLPELRPIQIYVYYQDSGGGEILCQQNQVLKFPVGLRNIRFIFAINDLNLASDVLYRYKISSEKDSEWSIPTQSNSIEFSTSSGRFYLDVQVFDGGMWHGVKAPFQIFIPLPWWRQWWVISFSLFIGFVVISLLYRWRLRRYKHEVSIANQIVDLESRALHAQMSPHFIFNCLNAIQECVVTNQIDAAYMYLSKFSKLLRQILEYSDKPKISLNQELEVLDLYISLEQLRFRNEINFQIILHNKLDPEEVFLPPMLIQPHIENAISHGLRLKEGPKNVSIFFNEKVLNYLFIEIEDNGIGRTEAKIKSRYIGKNADRTSRGIDICQQRIAILKREYSFSDFEIEDLYDQNGFPQGTKVKLTLPMLTTE